MDTMETPELEEASADQWPGLHGKLFDNKKSNLQKYKEMVVGEQGWFALLRYELTILLFSQIPGALGLVLRRIFFPPLFKHVGRNVTFGHNLTLRQPHKIRIGDNVIIDDGCLLDAKGIENEGIVIDEMVTLGRLSMIVCKDADIHINSHVNIGSAVKIIAANKGKITIGKSIDIGSTCHFSAGSYDYSQPDLLPSTRRLQTKGIVVEDLSWIGVGVVVLDGVTIGTKSIIGAGAVVNKDVPPNSVAVGVPAEVVRQRE
ncbi:MAG: acyltransferase [Anaerolineales bacterium]|jgi:acetyltransferase-like isoleucine patch superfamily enzyme